MILKNIIPITGAPKLRTCKLAAGSHQTRFAQTVIRLIPPLH